MRNAPNFIARFAKPEPSHDANKVPYFENFWFGLYECLCCNARCFGAGDRVTKVLRRPIFADFNQTEILYPGGRHSFHPECWREFEKLHPETRRPS